MLIEKKIEAAVAAALTAALTAKPLIPGNVFPSWAPRPKGTAPDTNPNGALTVHVRAAPRAYSEYSTSVCTITVEIQITFQTQFFSDRSAIAPSVARLLAPLQQWNTSHTDARADLTIPSHFRCDGALLPPGQYIDDLQDKKTIITQTLDILGVILPQKPSHSPGVNAG